jgi:DNA-binding LytR/AlgR family response regulator
MKRNDIIRRSVHIIREYYKGNLSPFFESIDENILWIGPRDNQIITSRQGILDLWSTQKDHPLLFTMSSISAKAAVPAPHACEVILKYRVFTHYPDGVIHAHNQRIQYTWTEKTITKPDGQKERIQSILVIHITNTVKNDERDPVYAVHSAYTPLEETEVLVPQDVVRYILFRGRHGETYSYLSTNIRWIENCDEGRHSLVHTQTGSLPSMERLTEFIRQARDVFLRPHHSYLVNPLYIRSIRRFTLTMTDGTVLPIPEKKYTAFRNELKAWGEQWNRH